jgi:hypothetical protein
MNVITNNQIVYDSGLEDGDYENAFGRRGGRGRKGGRGREGGRRGGRKRTGVNRAIGVIPVVAGARYLQRRRAERQEGGKQSQSSQSAPRMANPNRSDAGQYQGRQSQPRMSNPDNSKSTPIPMGKPSTRPPRSEPPNRNNPLQGKPNSIQQDVAITNSPIPTPSNNKKIALIVGGVLLLGVAAYFYSKKK